MENPHVTAVMLTADRQAMTDRAVRCFEAQHYANKSLLILDTGTVRYRLPSGRHPSISIIHAERGPRETLGELRNFAIKAALFAETAIATLDSDDWSYPWRFTEQVKALIATEAECVGYHNAMFYDVQNQRAYHWKSNLQPNAILGGSAMYWRKTWERVRFPHLDVNEDSEWMKEVRIRAIDNPYPSPKMIVTQHGGNTRAIDFGFQCEHAPDAWKRVPEWDKYCERTVREA